MRHYTVLVGWAQSHSTWHHSVCAAPTIVLLAGFAGPCPLIGPPTDYRGAGGTGIKAESICRWVYVHVRLLGEDPGGGGGTTTGADATHPPAIC